MTDPHAQPGPYPAAPPPQPSASPGQPSAQPAPPGPYPTNPAQPGAYPEQPGAYPTNPAQPGAYPAYPPQPGAYPAYPAQPGGYPAPPGAYPAQPGAYPGADAAPIVGRPPGPGECRLCGSSPAAAVTFRGHRGFIILMKFLSAPGPYCRDCGLSVFRSMTEDTLILGWWGVISVVATPVTAIINVVERLQVSKLGQPRRAPDVVAPLPAPLDPGKPLYGRPKFWISIVLVFAGVIALGAAIARDSDLRSVGGCTSRTQFVSCDGPHDGKIIEIVNDQADCPSRTDAVLIQRTRVYCLIDD